MTAFYNEIEPFAAHWLEALIEAGEVTDGRVERRSIADLGADDLSGVVRAHFFAGIGGWDYALDLAGWPADAPVWTGSCPCQPFSAAGKGLGEKDPRHLWPEFRRLISECRPPVVFGEQVASRAGRDWLAGVRADLETLGYAVGAADLCAASVGAPHIRQRLFWVAHREGSGSPCRGGGGIQPVACTGFANGRLAHRDDAGQRAGVGPVRDERHDVGRSGEDGGLDDSDEQGPQGHGEPHGDVPSIAHEGHSAAADRSFLGWGRHYIPCSDGKARRVEPGVRPLAHGIPGRVGQLRGYGNAIVPQVAATFVMAFMEAINTEVA